jgi:hypothetical protein
VHSKSKYNTLNASSQKTAKQSPQAHNQPKSTQAALHQPMIKHVKQQKKKVGVAALTFSNGSTKGILQRLTKLFHGFC